MDIQPAPAKGLAKSLHFSKTKKGLFYGLDTPDHPVAKTSDYQFPSDEYRIPRNLSGHKPGRSDIVSQTYEVAYHYGGAILNTFLMEVGKHDWRLEIQDMGGPGVHVRYRVTSPDSLMCNRAKAVTRIAVGLEGTTFTRMVSHDFTTDNQQLDILVEEDEHPPEKKVYNLHVRIMYKKYYKI